MKKILMGLMMGAMCTFVSAQQPTTTTKQDKSETTSTTTTSKKQIRGNMSTPGYSGTPKPSGLRRHSNPIPKLEKRPEGTNPTLSPR